MKRLTHLIYAGAMITLTGVLLNAPVGMGYKLRHPVVILFAVAACSTWAFTALSRKT